MSECKPSELLFVRCILPHCKRIGPLWLKNVTNLRRKSREHGPQTTSKAHDIYLKMDNKSTRQLNEEINIVVNLLRKLYREIQPPHVMNLIKCWLNFPEIKDDDSCILTKGDCRGRMKRIDGGKGADKVWRLDTLIGIMFHGLPLTSADSNMIYHTCQHDLCIRPQHLRFKAASVSLVLVLKALKQTGYSIRFDNIDKDRPNEFVDIAGPFGILELETLHHELVQVTQINSYKLACSSDDIFILDQNPSLKTYYLKNTPQDLPSEFASEENGDEIRKHLMAKLTKTDNSQNPDFIPHVNERREEVNKTRSGSSSSEYDYIDIPDQKPRLKRKINENLDVNYSSEPKFQKPLQSLHAISIDDFEEKELIEIMEKKNNPSVKSKLTNCMYSNVSDSPFKFNLDNLIRMNTRSESESTLESLDKKRSSQISISCYSQLKRNSGDDSRLDGNRSNELLDMLHSMRHQYNPGSSLKMTPNIFSPVSEIEES